MLIRHLHYLERKKARSQIRGVTLVEVLVAVIVLSIGLLGIAGLQVATTKYQLGNGARTAIAVLYSDFTDRVRMNTDMAGPNWVTGGLASEIPVTALTCKTSPAPNSCSLYNYQATWAAQQAVADSVLTTTACSATSLCAPKDMAADDMLTWRKRVRDSLPQGAAFITGNRRDGIDVTLMWMDKENTDKSVRTDDGSLATQVALVTSKNCSTDNSETGLAQQTCCPAAAIVPAGVRCTRFSFMP